MDYLEEVREQYENYPYPFRNPDDEKKRLLSTQDSFLEKINHYCYGGRQDFSSFRALVAGGGTGSAAIFLAEQLRYRGNSEVVYLDISKKSMEIAQKRAAIRGLDNIRWMHNSILDLPQLEIGPFDYINSVGVLHHLEDHYQGLRALGSVLKEDGCMGIMVYGRHGRAPVYQMQELMRLLNHDEENMQHQVDNTKAMISSLPPSNFFKQCEKEWLSEVDLYGDIGLYDLFLHSHDHGFDVLELYDWVESCGFRLVEFIGPKFESRIGYEPQTFIHDPVLLQKMRKMPYRRQQAIAELVSGLVQRHSFYLSRRENSSASLDDLGNVPFFFGSFPEGLLGQLEGNKGEKILLRSPDQISLQFRPGRFTSLIFKHMNGQRSLKTLFNKVRKDLNSPRLSDRELLEDFRPIYTIFNNIGWMLLYHGSIRPFMSHGKLQERVNRMYPLAQEKMDRNHFSGRNGQG